MRTAIRTAICVAVLLTANTLGSKVALSEDLFPDKNLEAAVRQQVFEKRNNQEPLTEDDVRNISTVKGNKMGIKSLAGLEKCRSLAQLELADNEITDLTPLKDLTRIQSLNLANNQIGDVKPLATLTGLQYLELSSNQIEDIGPLASLENMRSLYLSRNKLKDISAVAKLKKLWSLYLDQNQLEDIKALTELKSLDTIDLAGNQIADVTPLAELRPSRFLFLQGNKVTDIGVLVAMAKKDSAGEKSFAPFWNVDLSGNPLSDEAKSVQLSELREQSVASRIHFNE